MIREVDLHNHDYIQACIKIQDELENAFYSDITELKFCHGSNRGTVIRDYIRKGRMKREAPPEISSVLQIIPNGPSYTTIKFG